MFYQPFRLEQLCTGMFPSHLPVTHLECPARLLFNHAGAQIHRAVRAAASAVPSDWLQVRIVRVLRSASRQHGLPGGEEAGHSGCERGSSLFCRGYHMLYSTAESPISGVANGPQEKNATYLFGIL